MHYCHLLGCTLYNIVEWVLEMGNCKKVSESVCHGPIPVTNLFEFKKLCKKITNSQVQMLNF